MNYLPYLKLLMMRTYGQLLEMASGKELTLMLSLDILK